jgi:hypothetical protein
MPWRVRCRPSRRCDESRPPGDPFGRSAHHRLATTDYSVRSAHGVDGRPDVQVGVLELAAVEQERQEQMEQVLAVRVAADVASQELRHGLEDPAADRDEPFDGPEVREEPLSVPEGVGVLLAEVSDRGGADVTNHGVRAQVRQLEEVDPPCAHRRRRTSPAW